MTWNPLGFLPAHEQADAIAVRIVRHDYKTARQVSRIAHYGTEGDEYLLVIDQMTYLQGGNWRVDRTTFTRGGDVKTQILRSE